MEYDVILDVPDVYLDDKEWNHYNDILKQSGIKTYVDLFRERPYLTESCFNNFLIILPTGIELLTNVVHYPAAYDAIKLTIVDFAHRICKKSGWHKTSDSMPHITLETKYNRLHVPIPRIISVENFSEYMEVIKTAIQSISHMQKEKCVEFIFDIDEGFQYGKLRTFEEYGAKYRMPGKT